MTTSAPGAFGFDCCPQSMGMAHQSAVRHAPAAAMVLDVDVLLLGALLIANCTLSAVWPGPATTVATTLLWLAAIARMFAAAPGTVVMMLPFIIPHFSVMTSLGAIEAGAYMKEMGSWGQASSAAASYSLYSLLFLLTCMTVARRRSRIAGNPPTADDSAFRPFAFRWGAVAVTSFVVAYLLLAGSRTGFPLLTGTDRFQYRSGSADVLTLNFLNLKFVLAAFLGSSAIFATTVWQRASHHAVFLGYVLTSFLFGDKFFIILVAGAFYAMPFMIHNPADVMRKVARVTPFALLIVICVLMVTTFIYSDYGNLSIDQTVLKLGDRIAGQGQLWFLAVRDSSHLIGLDMEIVRGNFLSLFANPGAIYVFEHGLGPFYFVEKYAPFSLYMSFIHNGGSVTPTMVLEAYGLVAFGYLGLALVMITLGVAIGVFLRWLGRGMVSGNPFNALLPAFVTAQALSLMSQGTIYSLIGLSAWKAYGAFLALQIAMPHIATFAQLRRAR